MDHAYNKGTNSGKHVKWYLSPEDNEILGTVERHYPLRDNCLFPKRKHENACSTILKKFSEDVMLNYILWPFNNSTMVFVPQVFDVSNSESPRVVWSEESPSAEKLMFLKYFPMQVHPMTRDKTDEIKHVRPDFIKDKPFYLVTLGYLQVLRS